MLGVVISASHNPFQDNGVKIFSRDGFKLPDEMEDEIESLVVDCKIDHLRPTATAIGKASRVDDALGRYNAFAKTIFPRGPHARRLKVVIGLLPMERDIKLRLNVWLSLALRSSLLAMSQMEKILMLTVGRCIHSMSNVSSEKQVPISVLLSMGMPDRAILVDETGEIVDGDAILAIAAQEKLTMVDCHIILWWQQ